MTKETKKEVELPTTMLLSSWLVIESDAGTKLLGGIIVFMEYSIAYILDV